MARQVRSSKLDTRSARARLAPRTAPYWLSISPGCHIGYYKGRRGGSWIAKYRGIDGVRVTKKLGVADDTLDADDLGILTFAQAQIRAQEWFKRKARVAAGVAEEAPGPYKVADAIRDYLAWFERNRKSTDRTRIVASAHILPALGNIELAHLTKRRLEEWRDKLAATPPRKRSARNKGVSYREASSDPEAIRRRRSSANRIWTVLRSALNRAFQEGHVASDEAWRKIKPYRAVDGARVRWLTDDEIRRLLNACDTEPRALVTAALFTGARYGELSAMRAGDVDLVAATVWIRPGKSGRGRHVYLTAEATRFFRTAAKGKRADDLLFLRTSGKARHDHELQATKMVGTHIESTADSSKAGKPWGRSEQQRPLVDACKRAEIVPAISFHGLRHTFASRLVQRGVSLKIVADQLGHTDTRMVEKHYGHLAESHVAKAVRAAFGELGIAPAESPAPHGEGAS